ncbi:hypothetical protein [Methanosarcina barkeri]|uniref:DUF2079 domain-containing protein n=1 Tax=Methanosarcina barkeri CM1 TaxID=796385 RepID=A0A0G3CCX4_METBA|nr:hypothetical protein [Methanosarcina barkeri]AKJ39841.1 hypothetical protein MCM1_2845 [Methanosarcina barkeri CM1]
MKHNNFCNASETTIIIKSIASICFLFIIYSLIKLNTIPAAEYEASIYKNIPYDVWICLLFSLLFGIYLTFLQLYNQELQKNNFLIVGILLIVLPYIIFISMFIIRGYYGWNLTGDTGSHLMAITQIIKKGSYSSDLFYPILHIYSAEFLEVSNINLIIIHKMIPLIFGILYLPFMYILSKSLLFNKTQIIFSFIGSTIFLHQYYISFTPNTCANLFFPVLLFSICKVFQGNSISWEIITVVLILLYPPFHPVPNIALIIILLAMAFMNKVFNLHISPKLGSNSSGFKFTLLTLLTVLVIFWMSSFNVWDYVISHAYKVMTEDAPSTFDSIYSKADYAQGYGYNPIEYLLKIMGGSMIYFIMSLSCFPTLWKKKNEVDFKLLFSLYGSLIALGFSIILFYLTNVGFDPRRLIFYITIISIIFSGIFFEIIISKLKCIKNKKISNFAFSASIIFIFIICLNGIFTLYPSPYVLKYNYQDTHAQIEGSKWIIYNRNVSVPISPMSVPSYRYSDFILASREGNKLALPKYISKNLKVPLHFGYENNTSISSSYISNVYLSIVKLDRVKYIEVYPEMAEFRWSPMDFKKLDHDKSVNHIYSNSGFDAYYIFCQGQ